MVYGLVDEGSASYKDNIAAWQLPFCRPIRKDSLRMLQGVPFKDEKFLCPPGNMTG